MDIEFEWPGDSDHDILNALFAKYAQLERNLIMRELSLDPRMAVLEGEV
jgi:hypothetical protein